LLLWNILHTKPWCHVKLNNLCKRLNMSVTITCLCLMELKRRRIFVNDWLQLPFTIYSIKCHWKLQNIIPYIILPSSLAVHSICSTRKVSSVSMPVHVLNYWCKLLFFYFKKSLEFSSILCGVNYLLLGIWIQIDQDPEKRKNLF
jgi:hypothetical protein